MTPGNGTAALPEEGGAPAVLPPRSLDLTGHYPVMSLEWVAVFVHHVRRAVLNEWDHSPRRTCIPTIRIACGVARRFGITCVPYSAGIQIYDPASGMAALTRGTGEIDPVTGYWDAHLIANLGDTYLIDPSADQHGDPERGFVTAPWAIPCPPDAFRPGHRFGFHDELRPGRTIDYWITPEQGAWKDMAWWCEEHGRAQRAWADAFMTIRKATLR